MFVRRELALDGHGMLVPGADIEDIAWHGEAERAFGMNWAVVLFKCHKSKAGAINFLRDFCWKSFQSQEGQYQQIGC